ncbi:hypothetical protein B7463_g10532, partial [Scytalidium lignicola]
MAANLTRRPALGQLASMGTLYDARIDSFLSASLFDSELPADAINTSTSKQNTVKLSYVDTFEEKFEKLGIATDLGASILADFISLQGSSHYLAERRDSNHMLQGALYITMRTVQEQLNFMCSELKTHLTSSIINANEATHIVTGIDWGVETIISIRKGLPEGENLDIVRDGFRNEVETFKLAIEQSNVCHSPSNDPLKSSMLEDVTAYSDILTDGGVLMQGLQEAYEFLSIVPLQLMDENSGKGKAVGFTLFPISMLQMFLPVEIPRSITTIPISIECLRSFIQLFDQFHTSQLELDEYRSYVSKNKLYLPDDHAQLIMDRVNAMRNANMNLQLRFKKTIYDVRQGNGSSEDLWQLLRNSMPEELSPQQISAIMEGDRDRLDFINIGVEKGATYIGYNGLDFKTALSEREETDAYAYFFNKASKIDKKSWVENQKLLLELLNDKNEKKFVAIIDCDALGISLEQSRIGHFQNQQEISGDLLQQRQYLAETCFARYDPKSLETSDVKKPVKRRFVKIPCPDYHCNSTEIQDWVCFKCQTPIEYGFSDRYIYCDCGRSLYTNYDFKCKGGQHGPGFERYPRRKLLSLLDKLGSCDNLNILILGETGVGKSTFINAFVNYLNFDTLDDAMKVETLNYVIPCSFSTQIMDRSKPDNKIQQIEVKVGATRDDEHDGSKGQSATQQTTVYPITIGTSTIRLIDTPGIGDTRGLEYDRKNMADILATLSSYDEMHGILILLKSNNARLTVQFLYCVKELLTHLHRNAAANMVFGFTNTRISNYTPGDTFKPLEVLLNSHPDVGLGLTTHTTYCFDSESFRYLAAKKNSIFMDNEEDFRRSWNHSREEAHRLMNHFRSRPPHNVSSTISLNGTRELICELTKPMADISQLIRTNIAVCQDQMDELKNKTMSRDKLLQRLHMQKVQLKAELLDRPRTVCSHKDCTEVRDDGNEDNKVVTIYKAHCHPKCYLSDVAVDQMAHPKLIHCAAFSGSNFCTSCNHHWQEHLHVLYELHEHATTVINKEIEKQLKLNADEVTLKKTAIKEAEGMIEKYRKEHDQIQEAAAEFGLFLKKYSITPYNDATLAYLDFLIQDEEAKVNAGGSSKRLQGLRQDREKHKALIKVLEENMAHDANCKPLTEDGVDQAVRRLYGLPHFENNLKALKTSITAAHRGTYRERPYRIKNHSSSSYNTNYMAASYTSRSSRQQYTRIGSQLPPKSSALRREVDPVSQQALGRETLPYIPDRSKDYDNVPKSKSVWRIPLSSWMGGRFK